MLAPNDETRKSTSSTVVSVQVSSGLQIPMAWQRLTVATGTGEFSCLLQLLLIVAFQSQIMYIVILYFSDIRMYFSVFFIVSLLS